MIDYALGGPVAVPNITSMKGLSLGLDGSLASVHNVTSISLPDLEIISSGITLVPVPKLADLFVPKLKTVGGPVMINNTQLGMGVSLNLSFPALETLSSQIFLYGNLDRYRYPD